MSTNSRVTIAVGASTTPLDIFLKDTTTDVAIDASGITFRVFNPQGTQAISSTSGHRLSLGHYAASGTTIPAGHPIGEGWRIDWSVVLLGGASGTFSEPFCVTLPTLSATFINPEAEVPTIYDRVRVDTGDINGQIFTDGLLQRVLEKAISRVNRKLGLVNIVTGNNAFHFFLYFNSSITRPKIEVNLLEGTLTPDTDPYVDIVVLQMEEIVLRAEQSNFKRLNVGLGGTLASGLNLATQEGVSIRNADGVSISVSSSRFATRANLFISDVERVTEELEKAIRDFRWRLSGAAGIDVTIPRYTYNYYPSYYNGYNGVLR